VIAQKPNIPLIVWFLSMVLARVLPSQSARTVFSQVATLSISIWALLELLWGVNYFRRGLGLVVLIVVGVGLLR